MRLPPSLSLHVFPFRPFSIYPLPNSIFCQIKKRRENRQIELETTENGRNGERERAHKKDVLYTLGYLLLRGCLALEILFQDKQGSKLEKQHYSHELAILIIK